MPRDKKFAAHLAYSLIILVAVLIVVIADKSGLAARQVTPSGGVPKTGIAITHRSPSGRESAVRTLSYSDFWDAAENMDFKYVDKPLVTQVQRQFMRGLGFMFEGDLESAAGVFEQLADHPDSPRMREALHDLLAVLYETLGRHEALLTLIEADPTLIQRGVVDEGHIRLIRLELGSAWPEEMRSIPEEPFTIPHTLSVTKTPRVEVEINGKNQTFWLDTGSSGSLIASDVAEAAEVQMLADSFNVENLGEMLPLRHGLIRELRIGSMYIRDLPVAVLDKDLLRIGPERIAGIIGWPILKDLRLELDGRAMTVTISKSDWVHNLDRNFFWFDYPFVRLHTLDGVPVNFGLDTGADASRIKPYLLEKLAGLSATDVSVRGAGLGQSSVSESRVEMLDTLTLTLPSATLTFGHIKTTEGVSARFIRPDGKLSADVFVDTFVVLDFPAGRFDIRPLGVN